MPTNARKIADMKDHLDEQIGQLTTSVLAEGNPSIPLLAGLCLARVWLQDIADAGFVWPAYRDRLHKAVEVLKSCSDAGSISNFGLWDGLQHAHMMAGQIEGEPPVGEPA